MKLSTLKSFSVLLLLIALGFGIYSNTLNAPFYFDDRTDITENLNIRITELRFNVLHNAAFNSPASARPIANISFALNYYFHGYDRLGYHLVNITIHVLSGFFLFLFIKATIELPLLREQYRHSATIAFAASLIWLVHPLHTQSVTYIVQRMNSMAAMFYILSLLLYVKGRLNAGRRAWPWFVGGGLAWLISLGCKQISATLPLFVFLYEWYFLQNLDRDWVKHQAKYIFGILILFCLVVLMYLWPDPIKTLTNITDFANREFSLAQRIFTQARVVIYYISLLFFPHPSRLNLDHDFPISYSFINPGTTLLSLFIIMSIGAVAIYFARKDLLISFCTLWFLGNLAIESSIIPLAIIFEHRTYLPYMFVSLSTVALMYRYIKPKWLSISVFGVLLVTCSLWTYERNNVWLDSVILWADCVKKSPKKARPHNNLGFELYKQGRTEEAIEHYLQALRIKPDYGKAHNNLGLAFYEQGRTEEAIEHYLKVLQIRPDSAEAINNLGVALKKQGRKEEAIKRYLEALQIEPDYEKAHNNLGLAFYEQGRTEEAIDHFLQALRIKPDYQQAHNNLGLAFYKHGRTEEAINHFLQALQIKPDYVEAHYNLGNTLDRKGQTEEAIEHYLEALQIEPDYEKAHNNLGFALYKQGRTEEAIEHYLQALRIKPDYADAHNNLAIALFRKGNINEAISHFRKALRINPDHIHAKDNFKRLLMLQQKNN
ncbi:tetratricopeptide repeat protein [Thermodesulfobacteriota bacterium]